MIKKKKILPIILHTLKTSVLLYAPKSRFENQHRNITFHLDAIKIDVGQYCYIHQTVVTFSELNSVSKIRNI